MFGHLRAEEFIDLIESGSIAADRQKHLSSCTSCENRLQASILLAMKPDGKTPANTVEIDPLADQKITDYHNLIPAGKNVQEIVKVSSSVSYANTADGFDPVPLAFN